MAKHVLIIGAGIIGICCGYYLARKGFRVTIVDRAAEPHEGCSFGNAGMVVPSHFVPLAAPGMVGTALRMMLRPRSPFYVKPRASAELLGWGMKFWRASTAAHVDRSAPLLRDLHLASRAAYEELAEELGNGFELVRNGLLMLCKAPHALDEEAHTAEKARQLGVPAEVLDAKAAAELEPGVTMDVAGAVYFPKDCHLSPAKLMASLRDKLKAAGGTFVWNSALIGWRRRDGSIDAVKTSHGELAADEYLLCAGSWSAAAARELDVRLPLQAGKGYSLTLPRPRELPRICSILTEARVAVTPMGGTLRFGGTMEIAGLNERVNQARVRGIVESVPAYFPHFSPDDFRDVKPWVGLRPCSPDGLPYVGRVGRYDNLSVATGHAMMGISLGPVTGKLVAALLAGERPPIDISALSPDRYARH